jgi:hypothetical protein
MKKILICTANYYTSEYQVGVQNYARAFEKLGYRIAYLSAPISIPHQFFANNKSFNDRKNINKEKGKKEGNIWYYVPKVYLAPYNKPLLSSKYIFKNWYKFSNDNILELLKKQGFDEIDILWIESPLYSFLLKEIKYKKSILRIADYSIGMNNWKLFYETELELTNEVDKVIVTAKKLIDLYPIQKIQKIQYIPNGIDLDLIHSYDTLYPDEFENINGIKVIYIGMIDTWFDIELVYKAAKQYQDYNFIFIGNVKINVTKLKKLNNVYFLGKRSHNQIAKYLKHSDIGIIPFKRDSFVDSINPIKIYEYAAFNLKIVTTYWKEINFLSEYCFVCKSNSEFLNELQTTKVENKSKTREWLKNQDWLYKAKKAINFDDTI